MASGGLFARTPLEWAVSAGALAAGAALLAVRRPSGRAMALAALFLGGLHGLLHAAAGAGGSLAWGVGLWCGTAALVAAGVLAGAGLRGFSPARTAGVALVLSGLLGFF
ncbi:MAG: hypothetical protein KatS3mg124_0801 [Porticoccaceae bacterium]|nr:MAG: hypothetical protein KatS3mg124_0801 [Porticoccaceae bacterium]